MKNGDIQNFKLSNSCSAGNGMLLQAMADQFGIPVTEYAETAFKAELAPKFSYGCAGVPRLGPRELPEEGYQKEELLAGLAQVLPKNVWQYVVQIPAAGLARHQVRAARRHAVQPGAVKAQVDYIKQRVPGARCSCTRTPAKPARSARASRRCAATSAPARVASSASRPRSTSST
jgi:hypothetical protein